MENPLLLKLDLLDYSLTRTRAGLQESAIAEYEQMIRDGMTLEPALVYKAPDGKLFPATGEHRKEAYGRAGMQAMPCMIKPGSRWDAICEGIKDNRHGAKLTTADKRH